VAKPETLAPRRECPKPPVAAGCLLEFASESSAIAFERYLKTGSGRPFAKPHFI